MKYRPSFSIVGAVPASQRTEGRPNRAPLREKPEGLWNAPPTETHGSASTSLGLRIPLWHHQGAFSLKGIIVSV